MSDTLILVDENVDIKANLEIKNYKGKIISLDVSSHDQLSDLGIKHEIVESYLLEGKKQIIEDFAFKLSCTWYTQKDFFKILNYDGFNLGLLIKHEFYFYLIKKLKIILGIKEIFESEKPKIIFSSVNFFPILNFFDYKKIITKNELSLKKNHNEGKFVLPLTIKSKSYNVYIPKNFALKIAKFTGDIANFIFNFKLDIKKIETESSILILDLNPKPYKILLHELSKLSKNIILMNDVGPITWNKENIKIIKKSKSKIFGLNDLKDKKLDSIIKEKYQNLIEHLEKTFSYEHDCFSIDEISIWPLIKKDFFEICSKNFMKAIEVFELSRQLFKKIHVTNILSLYVGNVFQSSFIHIAQENNIPCINLQHGYDPLNEYLKNYFSLTMPKYHTKLMHGYWGQSVEDYMISSNLIENDQSIVLGNPRYDQLPLIKKQCKNTNTIILATTANPIIPFNLSGINSNNSSYHKKMFKEICKIINDLQDKKLIIKLHPAVTPSYSIQSILNKINPNISVFQTQNILPLLKDCEILVCLGHSTVLLESLILGKPTILFMTNQKWYEHDEIISSGAVLAVSSPDDLKNALKLILYDKNYREELIQKGNQFVEKYLSNLGTSSKNLAKILEKL